MAKFITNQQDLLKDVFNGHIPKSQGLDFLVGYFYFSGFSEIYKNIGDKKLRILIGMEAEIDINNIIYEFYKTQKEKNDSIDNMRKNYCKNIVDAINKTNSFDIEKAKDAFNFFFEKLADGSLEVKKTKELNHAKMYVFQYSKEYATKEMNGVVVVGSSNLSFNGLGDNNEVNVFLPDDNDYKNAQAIFNELWENAIPLFSQSNLKEFEKAVVEKVWFNKRPSPFLMYARVLQEYFQSSSNTKIKTPQILSRRSAVQYIDLQYQTDAVSDALNMLNRYDGCILSDVVGLGKSIIACAVAANMDRETIIICPPHLMDQWQNTAKDFSLVNVEIFSSGKLEDVLEKLENSKENNQKLIVVDEAHRYRNENTPTYAALHKICISNKVLLLSATPFNNKPEDIFSLLKLFQIPTCSKLEAGENV
ncbi:MAG: phospholipase D-like domain-containing protein, partial [Elusimicrobiota bacterium]|nr:phospholipase D-like domain-containing protein [Elusimicrobiota bacterium]